MIRALRAVWHWFRGLFRRRRESVPLPPAYDIDLRGNPPTAFYQLNWHHLRSDEWIAALQHVEIFVANPSFPRQEIELWRSHFPHEIIILAAEDMLAWTAGRFTESKHYAEKHRRLPPSALQPFPMYPAPKPGAEPFPGYLLDIDVAEVLADFFEEWTWDKQGYDGAYLDRWVTRVPARFHERINEGFPGGVASWNQRMEDGVRTYTSRLRDIHRDVIILANTHERHRNPYTNGITLEGVESGKPEPWGHTVDSAIDRFTNHLQDAGRRGSRKVNRRLYIPWVALPEQEEPVKELVSIWTQDPTKRRGEAFFGLMDPATSGTDAGWE